MTNHLITPNPTAPPRLRPRHRPADTATPEPAAHHEEPPLVLTAAQAAARLQVHPTTVLAMVRRGELRGRRIGTRKGWRIDAASLTAWLARG